MAGLADWLEDYRNWRGRQEWEQGKGWQDFFGGDPRAQEQFEKLSGFGTDAGGLVGMIKASHGSPHAFTKFDFSKIGTGEGAQAYGHGGYFAQGFDSPVAQEYQQALAGKEGLQSKIGGKLMGDFYDALSRQADKLPADKAAPLYEKMSFLEDLEQQPSFQHALDRIDDESIVPWAESLRKTYEPAGHMYNVELRWPDPAREAADPLGEHHLLDWDARLSEQPEYVRKAFEKADAKRGLLRNYSKILDPEDQWTRGGDAYSDLALALNDSVIKRGSTAIDDSHKVVSNYLRDLGIPGIRYLDQASRGAGQGTRNYVMFDDALANIVSRNGVSLSDLLQNQQQLKSLNPTGSVFAGYNPTARASLPLGENLTTLSETMGVSPDELITIYRGVPHDVSTINPGDFITTNQQLAKDYAGTGKVISQKVKASDILDDLNESLGEEYIYRPGLKKLLKK